MAKTKYLLLSIVVLIVEISGKDLTRLKGSSGKDVVDATIDQIKDSCIFQNDYLFLRRLAFVNSKFGTDGSTYRSGFDGGIWQISSSMHTETLKLTARVSEKIKACFGIDWSKTSWDDLRKPLYSGLAAMIVLETKTESIGFPKTAASQSQFFQSELSGKESTFKDKVKLLDVDCKRKDIDIAFVLDASGSVDHEDYGKSKKFVSDTLDWFIIGKNAIRVAVMSFSSNVFEHIDFDNTHDKASLQTAILGLPKAGGSTNTYAALDTLTTTTFSSSRGARSSSAKIAIIQTDGKSNNGEATRNAAEKLRKKGVTVFAIGIGNGINDNELHDIASKPACRHVRRAADFEELDSIISDIKAVACKTIVRIAKEGEIREECTSPITVSVEVGEGKSIFALGGGLALFGSFDVTRPNSALSNFSTQNDRTLPTVIYLPKYSKTLFMTIDTTDCTGKFLVKVVDSNHLVKTGASNLCVKGETLQDCTDLDFVKSHNPVITANATSFCAESTPGYHPHPGSKLKYFYCNVSSYEVTCPAGFAYLHALTDCAVPASTQVPQMCAVCISENYQMGLRRFPVASSGHQYVQCTAATVVLVTAARVCTLESCPETAPYAPGQQQCKVIATDPATAAGHRSAGLPLNILIMMTICLMANY